MPEQPIGQLVRRLRQAERVNPFLAVELAATDLVKRRHGAMPIGMAAIRLRLAAEIFRNVGDESVRFLDAAIDLGRQLLGMKEQRVIGVLAMNDGGPFAQALGQLSHLIRAGTQEFRLVHAGLHLDDEVFVGIGNRVDIAGRAHLGNERIIAG